MHAGGASTGVGYMQDVCLAQGGGCFMVKRIKRNSVNRPYPNTVFFVSFEILSHPCAETNESIGDFFYVFSNALVAG